MDSSQASTRRQKNLILTSIVMPLSRWAWLHPSVFMWASKGIRAWLAFLSPPSDPRNRSPLDVVSQKCATDSQLITLRRFLCRQPLRLLLRLQLSINAALGFPEDKNGICGDDNFADGIRCSPCSAKGVGKRMERRDGRSQERRQSRCGDIAGPGDARDRGKIQSAFRRYPRASCRQL